MKAIIAALLVFFCTWPAWSHALDPGYLELRHLGGERWSVGWKVPLVGAGPMPIEPHLPENCTPRTAPPLSFDGRAFTTSWVVTCPGGIEGGTIGIKGLEKTATDVLVRYELGEGPAESHRLTASDTDFTIPRPQGKFGVFRTYAALGVEHILAGADHLLFVFALLLLIRRPGPLIGAITAFTIAHSITLAASALDIIRLASPPVEATIALSIMFLASEILRPEGPRVRLSERYPWAVSFSFGLLHGLGFAGALRDIGLPKGEVPMALFAFNVGVEAGQMLFIAAVLVLSALMWRILPGLTARLLRRHGAGMTCAGYIIGSVSALWLIERLTLFTA